MVASPFSERCASVQPSWRSSRIESKGGAGGEHNKSTGGSTASTNARIVFRRYLDLEGTRSAIFTMYPNGSHIRQITNPPEGWGDLFPAWSPDGTKVAFHR